MSPGRTLIFDKKMLKTSRLLGLGPVSQCTLLALTSRMGREGEGGRGEEELELCKIIVIMASPRVSAVTRLTDFIFSRYPDIH